MYSDDQLKLLINAIESGNVIGMDRTFNVSSCYLTTICFKIPNVDNKSSSGHPIIHGPVFLNWDGNEEIINLPELLISSWNEIEKNR